MNRMWQQGRKNLHISTVNMLLYLKINGPDLEDFKAGKFVASWKRAKRRSAKAQNRKVCGKRKNARVVSDGEIGFKKARAALQ